MASLIARARAVKRALLFILRNLRNHLLPLTNHQESLGRRLREILAAGRPSVGLAAVVHRAVPRPADGDGLTLLSANLWHDWPLHRDLPDRLEAFARLVEAAGAQVVMVQEVARIPELHVDSWLAQRLGMQGLYYPANGHAEDTSFHLRHRVQDHALTSEPFPPDTKSS